MTLRVASFDRVSGAARYQALGRLKPGEKNKAEQRYEDEVLIPAMRAGEVLWYRFEGIKLRIAPKTFLTVDYAVLPKSGILEMHDVKGHAALYLDDAKVKMKVAADSYPFVFKIALMPRKVRGEWQMVDV